MYFIQCSNFIATRFILYLMTLAQGQQQETGITLNVSLLVLVEVETGFT